MTDRHAAPPPRRTVEALTRRTSLLTLAGTALAAIIPDTPLVEAKKKGKNARKRKRKKSNANDTCERQGPPCRDFADQFCALFNPPGPPRIACAASAAICCLPLEECQGPEFFDCLLGRIQSI